MKKKYVLIGLLIVLLSTLTLAGKKNNKRPVSKVSADKTELEKDFDGKRLIVYKKKVVYTSTALEKLQSINTVMASIESVADNWLKELPHTKEAFNEKYQLCGKNSDDDLGFDNIIITSLQDIPEGTDIGILSGVFSAAELFEQEDRPSSEEDRVKKLLDQGNFSDLKEWMFRKDNNLWNLKKGINPHYYKTNISVVGQEHKFDYFLMPTGALSPWQLLQPFGIHVSTNNLKLELKRIGDTAKVIIAVIASKHIKAGERLRLCDETDEHKYIILHSKNKEDVGKYSAEELISKERAGLDNMQKLCRLHNEAIESGERKGNKIDYETQRPLIEID